MADHRQQSRIKAISGWDVAERVSQLSVGVWETPPAFLGPLHRQGLDVRAVISTALPWELGALFLPGKEESAMM